VLKYSTFYDLIQHDLLYSNFPVLLNTAKNTRDLFAIRVRVRAAYLSSVIVIMSLGCKIGLKVIVIMSLEAKYVGLKVLCLIYVK